MKKKIGNLVKHTLIYGVGSTASRALAFLLIPLYTAYLSPSDYGVLQICRVINSILFVILSMGMGSSMFRVYYNVNDARERQLIVNSTIITFFVFSIIILSPLFIFSSSISQILLGVENSRYLFMLLLTSIFFESLFTLQLAVLRAEERSKVYSIFSIIKVFLYALLSILFVAVLKQKYVGAIQAGLLSLFIIIIFLIPFSIKGFKFKISMPYIREILHIGIPLAIGGLGVWVLNLSDRYMLKYLLPTETALHQVGLYSLGDKIASIIKFIVVMPFMLAWGALMFMYVKEPNAKEIYKSILNYFCFIIGIIGLFVSVFSKEIIMLMSQSSAYYDAFKLVPILSFSKILSGVIVVISVGVIVTKKTKYVALVNLLGALLNIILNFILIPRINVYGAAISSLLAFTLNVFLLYYFAQKVYMIPYDIKKIVIFFSFIIVIVSIVSFNNLHLIYKIVLFTFSIGLLPLFKLVSYDQLKTLYSMAVERIRR